MGTFSGETTQQFLARLNESLERVIVVVLASVSASGLDIFVKVFLKTHISLTPEWMLLILALWLDIGPNFYRVPA